MSQPKNKTKIDRDKLITLVTDVQNGDGDSFSELFNQFYSDVYYIAITATKDHEISCDITQETFIEIYQTIRDLKEPAAFVTWMKKIAYHRCTTHFKRKETKHEILVEESEDSPSIFETVEEDNSEFIPDEALDLKDFKEIIKNIIDALPDVQRSAIMMRYFDELSIKEIADIQEVSEGTVMSRLNYGRKAIKKAVEDYEKKHNTKLHAIPIIPLFKWFAEESYVQMPATAVKATASAVSVATGTTVVTSVAGNTGVIAAITGMSTVAKSIAGVVLAIAVTGGAGLAAVMNMNRNEPEIPSETTSEVTIAESMVVTETETIVETDVETETEPEPIWFEKMGLTFTPQGSFTYSTTYNDGVTTLGEVEVPATIFITETTDGCDEGYKKVIAYLINDMSAVSNEHQFTLSFTPFDKYSGNYLDYSDEDSIDALGIGSYALAEGQTIISNQAGEYSISVLAEAINHFPEFICITTVTCPVDYDGTAFKVCKNTIENYSEDDKSDDEENDKICSEEEIENDLSQIYFFTYDIKPDAGVINQCNHEFKFIDCSIPEICLICGTADIVIGEHNWQDATCSTPQSCLRCGRSTGETLEHIWPKYDCGNDWSFDGLVMLHCVSCGTRGEFPLIDHTVPNGPNCAWSTCEKCGKITGGKESHKWNNDICSLCGVSIYDFIECEHTIDNPLTGEKMNIIELLALVKGFDKIGTAELLTKEEIKVVKIYEETNGVGEKGITIVYSDGTASAIVECHYCHEFPCPNDGGENCLEYDITKDPLHYCQQCGKPNGDGYRGTCRGIIEWDEGVVYCNHYDDCLVCGRPVGDGYNGTCDAYHDGSNAYGETNGYFCRHYD